MAIDGAMTVANSIHHAVSKLILVQRASQERLPRVTVSVGVSKAMRDDPGWCVVPHPIHRGGQGKLPPDRS